MPWAWKDPPDLLVLLDLLAQKVPPVNVVPRASKGPKALAAQPVNGVSADCKVSKVPPAHEAPKASKVFPVPVAPKVT